MGRFENVSQGPTITDINVVKAEFRLRFELLKPPVLETDVVGIIEIIDTDDTMALG